MNFVCFIVLKPKAIHVMTYSTIKIPINSLNTIYSNSYFYGDMFVVYKDMLIIKIIKRHEFTIRYASEFLNLWTRLLS